MDALLELVLQIALELAGGLVELVAHAVGWLTLKALTLGRYPPPSPSAGQVRLVTLLGLAELALGTVAGLATVGGL